MNTTIVLSFWYLILLVGSEYPIEGKNICIKSDKNIALVHEEIVISNCGDNAPSFLNIGLDWGDGSVETKGQTGKHFYNKPGTYIIKLMIEGKPVSEMFSDAKYSQVSVEIKGK